MIGVSTAEVYTLGATNRSHLEKHGNQWRVTVFVPVAARATIGKAHLKHSLGTSNLATANHLKQEHVARFKNQIQTALSEAKPDDDALNEARVIRKSRRANLRTQNSPIADLSQSAIHEDDDEFEDGEAYYAVERAEQIEKSAGPVAAKTFADIAFGRATPINEYLETFLDDVSYQPRTILDLRRGFRMLDDWLETEHMPQTLEAITQQGAAAFIRKLMKEDGLSHKAAKKYRSFFSSYWHWLEGQGHIPTSTFTWSAPMPEPAKPSRNDIREPDTGKRPYTDQEIRQLLNGSPPPYLGDLILIAALSGMRIEEIYRLRVRDCSNDYFNVIAGKTNNAVRRVPIHPGLHTLVRRMMNNKKPTAYLIEPHRVVVNNTGERSGYAGKAFTRFRRSCGIDERPNSKPKSNIDFHSFRRWFIKSARDALDNGAMGFSEWTIASVVGHYDHDHSKFLKMTRQYAGPSSEEAAIACVNSVNLNTKNDISNEC